MGAARAADGPHGAAAPRREFRVDFAAFATDENPLSGGGVWTNNTQGTGGNRPPLNMTSMRVGLAADGVTRIAMPTHGGVDYDDSFAFVPGFGRDQWCEAVLYKAPGYNPNAAKSNHEVEIILGCRTSEGYHRWNECLLNAGGGVDIVSLDGGPKAFNIVYNGGMGGRIPRDGDRFMATKVGDRVRMYLNGHLIASYRGPLIADGSGIGIAGFIRPGAQHEKFGFRRLAMGSF